jgi:hypothetical protein
MIVLQPFSFTRERFRYHRQSLFFPQINLRGVSPIFCCQFVTSMIWWTYELHYNFIKKLSPSQNGGHIQSIIARQHRSLGCVF